MSFFVLAAALKGLLNYYQVVTLFTKSLTRVSFNSLIFNYLFLFTYECSVSTFITNVHCNVNIQQITVIQRCIYTLNILFDGCFKYSESQI